MSQSSEATIYDYYQPHEEVVTEKRRKTDDNLKSLGAGDPGLDDEAIQWTPELTLMLAILEDAIACYRRALKRPRQNPEILARQAEFWFTLDDWDSPFSFNNICEALNLEPVATRERIMQND